MKRICLFGLVLILVFPAAATAAGIRIWATPEPLALDTPAETEEWPVATPEPALRAETQDGISSAAARTVYGPSGAVEDYSRRVPEQIRMPAGDGYTRNRMGVLAFRGSAFRQNAACGTADAPSTLRVLWKTETGSMQDAAGSEWNGQPLIAKWSVEIRSASNLAAEKRDKTALKEVILPGADGRVHFLDLEDGTRTRDPLDTGEPLEGTPALHTGGMPLMIAGSGSAGLRRFNLYTPEEMAPVSPAGREATGTDLPSAVSWTPPLVDYMSDTAVTAGSDGMLYLISLHSEFDWRDAHYSGTPSAAALKCAAPGGEDSLTAVQSAVAMYDRYAFCADMGGILRCVDTDTLSPVWMAETGDSVTAAVALDQPDSRTLDLYTANVLNLRSEGNAQVRRYNALNGKEIWRAEIGVDREADGGAYAGFAASPVVGQNGLDGMVFFTVTGLNDQGRTLLDLPEGTRAAVVALDKEGGDLCWAAGLPDRSVSSPCAVYDEGGNGWIVQCAQNGTVLLLDGLTGEEAASLSVDGRITSSPAVYRDVVVISAVNKGAGAVYGVSVDPR